MSAPLSVVSCLPRRARLAASLAIALGATLSLAQAAAPGTNKLTPAVLRGARAGGNTASQPATPWNPTFTTHHVTTCADDGSSGSLRSIIADVVNTISGDVIDFTQLPMQCSTITLAPAGGAIQIHQDSLYLQGPGADQLTIDGGNQSSVLFHFGAGTLGISGMTISNGLYDGSLTPLGGCIYSAANVSVVDSTISHCSVTSSSLSNPAAGGGIFATGSLSLLNSKIADSHAFAQFGVNTFGGGAFAVGGFIAHGSEISGNSSFAIGGASGYGGGVVAGGPIDMESSTIADNRSDAIGALELVGGPAEFASITNSTISGNSGSTEWGGIWTNESTTLANSTVAFNRAPFGTTKKGDGVYGTAAATLTLKSSIIAGNWRADGQSDLDGAPGVTLNGSNDLITSSAIGFPLNTITVCPQFDPLLNNGGNTRTHALRHTSPAIDQGDAGTLTVDQRGAQRTVGVAADIGSVERQPGELDERIFANGFDGLCDQ
jgi:hypothetical protein